MPTVVYRKTPIWSSNRTRQPPTRLKMRGRSDTPIDWKRFTPCSHTLRVTTAHKGRTHTSQENPGQTKSVWHLACKILRTYRVFGGHGWAEGRFMTGLVDSPIAQYAVIEARSDRRSFGALRDCLFRGRIVAGTHRGPQDHRVWLRLP
jgi:hypothetical protein